MIREEIRALAVPIDSVTPYARNPRSGDTDAIGESLRRHGQYRPIVVRHSTREVLAGNHTYAAMMEAGATEIAVTFVDCTDDEAKRIVIVDNRTPDLAVNDDGLLAELLGELDGLDGTGWDDPSYERLLAELGDDGGFTAGKATVRFALGLLSFEVSAAEYEEWAAAIRELHDPTAELRARLGL